MLQLQSMHIVWIADFGFWIADYAIRSAIRNPQSEILFFPCSLRDPRLAKVKPVARIEVLAVIDDDLQPFHIGNVELDGLGRLVAGDFGFNEHAIVADDGEPQVARAACRGIDAGECNKTLVTDRQSIDKFRAAAERKPFGECAGGSLSGGRIALSHDK